MLTSTLPILDAILAHLQRNPGAFHVPGHKLGRGLPEAFGSWLGAAGRLDLTELPGLDDLHAPEGAIQAAQQLAAEAFGAEETYFLVNGSTAGNIAMVMTAVRPHETILVPRNLHKSVLNALILAQARPVYYDPDVDEAFGIPSGVSAATIRQALADHKEAQAVLVVSPTYHGICSDLQAIAACVHEQGKVLLVDEAHGAHFAFHEDLPPTAMAAGADMAVQSTHKMLGSLTQSSMLHLQGARIDRVRLRKRLQLVQSTSPSYLLMASLDCARQQMQTQGLEHLERALAAVRDGVEQLKELSGLRLLEASHGYAIDPLKWTIQVTGRGITGAEAYGFLLERQKMALELYDPQNVLAVFSYADGVRQVERLVKALAQLPLREDDEAEQKRRDVVRTAWQSFVAPPVIPLHEAFELESEGVSLKSAVGRVAAEMVIPYPPGIPLIVPGEAWTEELVAHVQDLLQAGVRFQGAEDARLQEVRVLKRV